MLPFSRPTIEDDEVAEVVDSLRSGWITSGPKVQRFEAMFTERLGVEHAVAVCSATAGLHIAIAALGLGPEDEVIVPALTWASTANVVELCGARTVFADIDPGTLNIDPADVARRITPRTKAIVPVHYAGAPADLDAIGELAAAHGLPVLEDAAHAVGTFYKGREVGSTGQLAVFSFHPIKNITTGEGGMIVLGDGELAERLRLLRFHGVSKDAWRRYKGGGRPRYEVVEPGWKYNMLDLQAALGIVQLQKLERFNARRAALAERYLAGLAEIPEVQPLAQVPYPHTHAWHLFVVKLDLAALSIDRDGFMGAMEAAGVGTGLHFPALHSQGYYRDRYGYQPGDLPHAEDASERILSLPLYPLMSDDDLDGVLAAIRGVVAVHRR
ncbi:MAG: aminotransferase class I/II-fold pyridoxal phosphate-dependent enzyme [Planctomycetota bacterium]